MLLQSVNAAAAKARYMFGEMLSSEQYYELCSKSSIEEACDYLKMNTDFRSVIAALPDGKIHRARVEYALNREKQARLESCMRLCGNDSIVCAFIVKDIEADFILACVRNILGDSEDRLNINASDFIRKLASFDVKKLAEIQSFSALAELLRKTDYFIPVQRFAENHESRAGIPEYARLETELLKAYFNSMYSIIEANSIGTAKRDIMQLLLIRADMLNVNTLFRLKTYFDYDNALISEMLIPYGDAISKSDMKKLIEAPRDKFVKTLQDMRYGRKIPNVFDFMERETGRIRYSNAAHLIRFSADPRATLISYFILLDMEIKNITRIIEGIHYKLKPEEIKNMLFTIK